MLDHGGLESQKKQKFWWQCLFANMSMDQSLEKLLIRILKNNNVHKHPLNRCHVEYWPQVHDFQFSIEQWHGVNWNGKNSVSSGGLLRPPSQLHMYCPFQPTSNDAEHMDINGNIWKISKYKTRMGIYGDIWGLWTGTGMFTTRWCPPSDVSWFINQYITSSSTHP